MATITVDDREIETKEGTPLLQALLDAGIFIPHFCYHQDLPVDGNCRQCLVEMDGPRGPMGTTSCTTPVNDGMVVRTDTPLIEKARRGVLEYLLVNHPVDCPVCDQAGECRLQEYYMTYGFHESRVDVDKVHKNKTLKVGSRVMLDQERCVLCSRCVRFLGHVTETHELMIGGRGDHSFITTFPGHEIENKYSVNTVDICPVGALTDDDFRFKCRVWYLKQTNTICHGCSRGCNSVLETFNHTTMDGLNGTAYRMKPRRNPEVNKSWMCDEGRLLYKTIDDHRLETPLLKKDQEQTPVQWDEVLDFVVDRVNAVSSSEIAGLCSPDCTNEEIYLFRQFILQVIGSDKISCESLKKQGYQDNLLLRADKHSNSKGAEFQGPWISFKDLLSGIQETETKVLIIFRNNVLDWADQSDEIRKVLSNLETLIVIDSNLTATSDAADAVLATGSFAEREGTYVNFEGRIQRTFRAYLPRWDSKPEIEILRTLATRLEKPLDGLSNAIKIWNKLAEEVEAFKNIDIKEIGSMGVYAHGFEITQSVRD